MFESTEHHETEPKRIIPFDRTITPTAEGDVRIRDTRFLHGNYPQNADLYRSIQRYAADYGAGLDEQSAWIMVPEGEKDAVLRVLDSYPEIYQEGTK